MDWLAAQPERRSDPRTLWPQVRAVVMLGVNYGPDRDPIDNLAPAIAAQSRSMPRATTITT